MKTSNSINARVAEYACKDIPALQSAFHISEDGYSREQIRESKEQYGENVVTERRADTIWYRLRRAFVNPFTLILFVLASISLLTDILLNPSYSRNITTVPVIVCMLLISGIVRFMQEMRSKRITDHLTELVNTVGVVRRDGEWTEVASDELAVGELVRLSAGDRVPADIRLTKALDMFVTQSAITGESALLEKTARVLSKTKRETCSEYGNIVFMGSSVIGGNGEGIILAVGRDTTYGEISGAEAGRKSGFEKGANSIAGVLMRFTAILVPVVFVACGLTKNDWVSSFLFALSVAVGLTPEMLPMVLNACLAKGSAAMEKKDTIVKDINAMQAFGSMDVLCVDKTGTLTGDEILLEYYMDIIGNEYGRVLDYAYLNSLYHTGVKNHLDQAILRYHGMPGKETYFDALAQKHMKLDELPFDYERKLVSTLVKEDGGNLLLVKGDLEAVCRRCGYVEYQGRKIRMEADSEASVHAVVDEMTEDGMKVLAVAYKPMQGQTAYMPEDEQDLILLGYLAFFDAPKKSAASAIEKLKELHVDVKVLTGDQRGVAVSVLKRLGLKHRQVLTGAQLEALSEDEAAIRIEKTTIFAELSPRQKANIVNILQGNGHSVGFMGDGMNDLSAIVGADVGISVENAVEAVQDSAEVILLKKDLDVLEEGILEGRKAFANMSKYIRITSSSNYGNILSIVIASVFLPFLPMASVQLLLLNLLYDILCLVLPWDNVDEEIYSLPREWTGRTLGRFMKFFGPVSSIFDILTFAFLYFILCPAVCGGTFTTLTGAAAQAQFIAVFQTGWFLESMWTQVLILHLLRTKKLPLLQSRPSGSVLSITFLGIVFFTILTSTKLGALLGLTAMPPYYYGFLIVVVILYLLLVTFAKWYYVRRYHELI